MVAQATRYASGGHVAGHERLPSGALRVRVRAARTGPHVYRREDGSEWVEYRSREALLAAAATLKDAPLVRGHFGEQGRGEVSIDNWRERSIGHVSDVDPQLEVHDGEEWLCGHVIVSEGSAVRDVLSGALLAASPTARVPIGPAGTDDKGRPFNSRHDTMAVNYLALLPPGKDRAGGARLMLRADSLDEVLPMSGTPDSLSTLIAQVATQATTIGKQEQELAELRPLKARVAELEPKAVRADSAAVELATVTGERDTLKLKVAELEPKVAGTDVAAAVAEELAFRERYLPDLPKGYDFNVKDAAGKVTLKPRSQVLKDAITFLGGEVRADSSDVELRAYLDGRKGAPGAKVPTLPTGGGSSGDSYADIMRKKREEAAKVK